MTFKEKLQHKYALSEQGAKDMIHAFISATISNIVLMFPVGMLYLLVKNYMEGTLKVFSAANRRNTKFGTSLKNIGIWSPSPKPMARKDLAHFSDSSKTVFQVISSP